MHAFEACVARQGLAATTLADVAAEAALPRSLVRYFMGNRDDMVDRLIERLMVRSEASLSRVRDEKGAADLDGLIDLYAGEVFGNELTNTVMGELWYVAKYDQHVRERLHGVYDYAIDLLVGAMARNRAGRSSAERQGAAYAILALALGDTSLRDFGIAPKRKGTLRAAMQQVVDRLDERKGVGR